jgi:hypothetical protein
MPFKKGDRKLGGRSKGTPNRTTRELRDCWHKFFESSEYQENAKARMSAGKAPHLEAYLLPKIYGKAIERHEVSGPDGGPIPVHDHFAIPPKA